MFVIKKCYSCGIEFFRPRSTGSKIKYCSQYCRNANGTIVNKRDRAEVFERARKREYSRWFGKRRHAKMIMGDKIDSLTVFELFDWQCIICDKEIHQDMSENHPHGPSLEHVIPLSRGGTHTWFNVGPAHVQCNRDKRDTIDEQLIDKVYNIWSNEV